MNQIEKLASANYLIKKAEMDVGTSALTGGALGSLLLALLSKGRRMGTGYRPSKGPYTAFPKIKTNSHGPMGKDLQVLGGIAGGVGGAGAGGLLAALSNALNKENN
jgi:hypothetical protein